MTTDLDQQLDRETLLGLYRTMFLIRRCEEQLARHHQQGLVHGACHTYVGEEAIATGVCANLSNEDVVFSTHRGHGHALAKGVPPKELIAEISARLIVNKASFKIKHAALSEIIDGVEQAVRTASEERA